MNSLISIVIADDHPLLLNGLKDYLLQKSYNVLAATKNGKEATKAIQEYQPNIAILDIEMPEMNGFEVARFIRKQGLSTKVILLSYHKEAGYTARAKELNIRAYIIKEDALNNIDECIRHVMKGNLYFSKTIAEKDISDEQLKLQYVDHLTPSEKRILLLIANKMTSQEISEELSISKRTVEKHRSNISTKLDLSGKAHELLSWAIENKTLLDH